MSFNPNEISIGRVLSNNVQYMVPRYFNLTINKTEADVVRRIYRWYLNEGYGAAKIAAMLNARGIKTKRGVRVVAKCGLPNS